MDILIFYLFGSSDWNTKEFAADYADLKRDCYSSNGIF